MVEARTWAPLLIIDAYWDARGRALCPAAQGVSFHVSPRGDLEPCPPIQLSAEVVNDGRPVFDTVNGSAFLRAFRRVAGEATPGCILMERPELLGKLAAECGAWDSSGRGTVLAELAAMPRCSSQHMPGREVPERHWFYRLLKKGWFGGLGSYA